MWPLTHLAFDGVHVAVSSHAVLVVVAVAAGMLLSVRRARAPLQVLGVAPAVAAAGLAGAWLLFRSVHGAPGGGLTSMGGLAAGLAAAAVASRVLARPLPHLLDDLAPGAILGLGIGRIGCFLAGCCFGRETDVPWAVVLPEVDGRPRHPLQLYAAAIDVALAFALVRRAAPPGATARRALVGLGLARLALETVRDPAATDPLPGGCGTVAQLGAVLLVLAGLCVVPLDRTRRPLGPATHDGPRQPEPHVLSSPVRPPMPSPRSRHHAVLALLAVLVLPVAGRASTPRTLELRFPAITVPAGGDLEACWVVHVPVDEPFDLVEWHVRHRGTGGAVGVRHFLVQQYVGDEPVRPPARGDRPVRSRGCLEMPWQSAAAVDARIPVAGARGANGVLPGGLALRLAPAGGTPGVLAFVLAGNWANGSAKDRRVSTVVELRRAPPGAVVRRLAARRDDAPDTAIAIPPFDAGTAAGTWRPGRDVCVHEVSGAFHRRGRFLGVDRLDAGGAPANPDPVVANPLDPTRRHLFGTADYTDPGSRVFPGGLRIGADEALGWTCWFENGLLTPVALGCEESAGVVPGSPSRAAVSCPATAPAAPSCDPAAAGPRTGACVPAAVTAGAAPAGETCALLVAFWEPAPGEPCGTEGRP